MVGFAQPFEAEFIRIHPLKAESDLGSEKFAMMRVNVIACYANSAYRAQRFLGPLNDLNRLTLNKQHNPTQNNKIFVTHFQV